MKSVFDIRLIIAALFGIYGVVLTTMGIVAPSEEIVRADRFDINLWTGIAMLVVTVIFVLWSLWRPIRVPTQTNQDEQDT